MVDYSDILGFLEEIVEEIEFDSINLNEVKEKLQSIISGIEENIGPSDGSYDDFDFDDLD